MTEGISTVLLAGAAQASSSSLPAAAIPTLLGAVIGGVVALSSVLLKSGLDSRAEVRRHDRQLELDARTHERSLERLSMEVEQQRLESLRRRQAETLAEFLAGSLLVYRKIVEIRSTTERTGRDLRREEFFRLKGEIDPTLGQIALEQLRLVSPPETVEIAQDYWRHLRAGEATRDSRAVFDVATWKTWSGQFWAFRKELINRGRLDQGIAPTSAVGSSDDAPVSRGSS